MKRFLFYILLIFVFFFPCNAILAQDTANGESEEEKELNVSDIIFGHIADSYEFDILTFKDKKIAISL
ncbi:MAG: F0F1 ATP synthase subunit A, partial [Bacteroidales bacterium]